MHLTGGFRRLRPSRLIAIALALALALGLAGAAIAKALTLQIAKNAPVTNQSGTTTHENIAVTSRGLAIYTLSGDSRAHPECTAANGCFRFWPPVTVPSGKNPSKASRITGKLGVWRRDGFTQVTLGGHPLYRYIGDIKRDDATGQGIRTFGGIWHVVRAAGPAAGAKAGNPSPPAAPTYPGY
jgi:predicted lipoprotein with Yx(FWY)xxD motif